MTALEAYELITRGGATDFAKLIEVCELLGPYCLIGGLAVNCYVEPVYTLDADIVLIASSLPRLSSHLREQGFRIEEHPHTVNALAQASELRIQFTTDERYQAFLTRSVESQVLGIRVRIACLEGRRAWQAVGPNARRTNQT